MISLFTQQNRSKSIYIYIYMAIAFNIFMFGSSPNLVAADCKIVAKEIIVTASNWADYVFQPNYYLTPLAELELKIKELGHLPGIPSKAEVNTNGVSINEMQVKMLEKIEELTLYMIELQKENEKLKTKINQIEGEIK